MSGTGTDNHGSKNRTLIDQAAQDYFVPVIPRAEKPARRDSRPGDMFRSPADLEPAPEKKKNGEPNLPNPWDTDRNIN